MIHAFRFSLCVSSHLSALREGRHSNSTFQKRNLTPSPLSCRQVMWLPSRQRPFVQKVAPGFQQMSGSKEAAASLRKGHIQWLNLRYTQVSDQELRCCPALLKFTRRGQR